MRTRRLRISLRDTSWPPGDPTGDALRSRAGMQAIDMDYALACTAILTRPPVVRGFSLGDTWAWLRYGAAVADRPDLRLRQEWTMIDPHQKTIFSDEVAVGTICYFLADQIGFTYFGDTNYVANVVIPGIVRLRRRARRGPSKSPDFIAVDNSGLIHVVECKGSQAAWRPLRRAMSRGRPQKRNVAVPAAVRGSRIVAGLFIPQWGSRGAARMHFIDPPVRRTLARLRTVEPTTLAMGIVQIFLAKHLALLGLASAADQMALTPVSALAELDLTSTIEASGLVSDRGGEVIQQAEQRAVDGEGRTVVRRVTARFPRRTVERLAVRGGAFRHISGLARAPKTAGWRFARDDNGVRAVSPLGLTLELSSSAGQLR